MEEGSWDTGQSKMITPGPPGNLTEYVNNKGKKKVFLIKDQTIIQQTSELLQKPQSLRQASCSEEASEQPNQRDSVTSRNPQQSKARMLNASEVYTVYKKWNKGERHSGDGERLRVTERSKETKYNSNHMLIICLLFWAAFPNCS